MREFFIITGITLGFLSVFLWLILGVYEALKYKPSPVDYKRVITVYQEISKAVETNEGKMDLDNVAERDDWDRFCLVVAYLNPQEYLKEFINEPSSIDNFLPDNSDDYFGIGILFVKDKEIIEAVRLPRYFVVPPSREVGAYIKSISTVSDNGNIKVPPLVSSPEKWDAPRLTCYTRTYTMKIHKDWKYSIVKKGNNDE